MIKFCIVWNFVFVKNSKIFTLSLKKSSKIYVACTTIWMVVSLSSISFVIWEWKKKNFIDFWIEFQRLFEELKHINDHFFEKFIDKLISIY